MIFSLLFSKKTENIDTLDTQLQPQIQQTSTNKHLSYHLVVNVFKRLITQFDKIKFIFKFLVCYTEWALIL